MGWRDSSGNVARAGLVGVTMTLEVNDLTDKVFLSLKPT